VEIPDYVMNFIKAICPESPELYMSFFTEQSALEDATALIKELRAKIKEYEDDIGMSITEKEQWHD
jgi:hypothetical protein